MTLRKALKATVTTPRLAPYSFAFCLFIFVGNVQDKAVAQSHLDELVRNAKLTLSAFECSFLVSDDDEKAQRRMLEVGLTAGRKFLAGWKGITLEEKVKISHHIDYKLFRDGPTFDFQLGQIYAQKETEFYEALNINFLPGPPDSAIYKRVDKERREKKQKMFREKNCFLI